MRVVLADQVLDVGVAPDDLGVLFAHPVDVLFGSHPFAALVDLRPRPPVYDDNINR